MHSALRALLLLALAVCALRAEESWMPKPDECEGCKVDRSYTQQSRYFVNNNVLEEDFGGEHFTFYAFDAPDFTPFWAWYAGFTGSSLEACVASKPELVYMFKLQRDYLYLKTADATYVHTAFTPTQAAWAEWCKNTYTVGGGLYWIALDGQKTTRSFTPEVFERVTVSFMQEECLLQKRLTSVRQRCNYESTGPDRMYPSQTFCGVVTANFTADIVLSTGCNPAEDACDSHYQTAESDLAARAGPLTLSLRALAARQSAIPDYFPDEDSDAVCWYDEKYKFHSGAPALAAPLAAAAAALAAWMAV